MARPHSLTGAVQSVDQDERMERLSLVQSGKVARALSGYSADSLALGAPSSSSFIGDSEALLGPDERLEQSDRFAKDLFDNSRKGAVPFFASGNLKVDADATSGEVSYTGKRGKVAVQGEWKKLPRAELMTPMGLFKFAQALSFKFEPASEDELTNDATTARSSSSSKDLNKLAMKALDTLVRPKAQPIQMERALEIAAEVLLNQKTPTRTTIFLASTLHRLLEVKSEIYSSESRRSLDSTASGGEEADSFLRVVKESPLKQDRVHLIDRVLAKWVEKSKIDEKEIVTAHEIFLRRLDYRMSAKSMSALTKGVKNLLGKRKRISEESKQREYVLADQVHPTLQQIVAHLDFGSSGLHGDEARLNVAELQTSAIYRLTTRKDLRAAAAVLGEVFKNSQFIEGKSWKAPGKLVGKAVSKTDGKLASSIFGSNKESVQKITDVIGEGFEGLFKKETSLEHDPTSVKRGESAYEASGELLMAIKNHSNKQLKESKSMRKAADTIFSRADLIVGDPDYSSSSKSVEDDRKMLQEYIQNTLKGLI